MLIRSGLTLGFFAVLLQIAVFLQPLLPKQYQIAPVCEKVTQALVQTQFYQVKTQHMQEHQPLYDVSHHKNALSASQTELSHTAHYHTHQTQLAETTAHASAINHSAQHDHAMMQHMDTAAGHDHHDPNHQCQYCTVYGHLVLPPDLNIKEVLVRIQVRFLAFEHAYQHVWFLLQRLFLTPQGRAPPLFA